MELIASNQKQELSSRAMAQLILEHDDKDLTSEAINEKHKTIVKLIETHKKTLSQWGKIEKKEYKEKTRGGVQTKTKYPLNMNQYLYVVSQMRNCNYKTHFMELNIKMQNNLISQIQQNQKQIQQNAQRINAIEQNQKRYENNTYLQPEQRYKLKLLISQKVQKVSQEKAIKANRLYPSIYARLKKEFKVPKMDYMKISQYEKAIEYINKLKYSVLNKGWE